MSNAKLTLSSAKVSILDRMDANQKAQYLDTLKNPTKALEQAVSLNQVLAQSKLYDVSTGSDFLSKKNALAQAAYEAEEESIADMIRNFEVGRNWNYIMGFADILKKKIPKSTENDQYSRAVGFPSFDHLVKYGKAVESAYMQGLSDSPMSLDVTDLTAYYAYVIAEREGGGKSIIDAFESGSEFLLTNVEKEAYDIARGWKQLVESGAQLPPEAAASDEFESVVDKWDKMQGTKSPTTFVTQSSPSRRQQALPTAQQARAQAIPSITTKTPRAKRAATPKFTAVSKTAPKKLDVSLIKNLYGNILPSSDATIQANTARIFALLGISYAVIQLIEHYRQRK